MWGTENSYIQNDVLIHPTVWSLITFIHRWHSEPSFHRGKCELRTLWGMKSNIFWDITPCSPLNVNRRFGGTYHLHLPGRRINRARNQCESRWQTWLCFHPDFLLCLLFDPEDGGDMFLRNVGGHSTDYTALYPIRQYSS
jgi:hypothetical protein